jgi:hypothetical protein
MKGTLEHEGTVAHVVRAHTVEEIDDVSVWRDTPGDDVADADELTSDAVVGDEGDQRDGELG